jgi:hypothetical protein
VIVVDSVIDNDNVGRVKEMAKANGKECVFMRERKSMDNIRLGGETYLNLFHMRN